MKTKIIAVLSVLIFILSGCVSEFEAKLPQKEKQTLIVDGSIVSNSTSVFHLSKSFSLNGMLNDSVFNEITVDNAMLMLIDGNKNEISQAENIGKGDYRMTIGELNENETYGIRIEYDGEIYESTPSKPLRTPEIDSISWAQPEEYGSVSFSISTHENSDEPLFFRWSFAEDWEINADTETIVFFENNRYVLRYPAPYYHCWKKDVSRRLLVGSTESLGENRIINREFYQSNPNESDRFTVLYSLNVSQKVISRAAHEYYQNKIKLNEEMGGLFTPQPSEFIGNIKCISAPSKHVIGFVDVSKNVTHKRIWVERTQVTLRWGDCDRSMPPTIGLDIGYCFPEEDGKMKRISIYKDCCEKFQVCPDYYVDIFGRGYRPIGYMTYPPDPSNPGIYDPVYGDFFSYWAKESCSDCRAAGGSKNKPDFWINDHE